MAHLLVFTPVTPGGLRSETVKSIVAQETHHSITWQIGRCNPYPPPDVRNVLAQYQWSRDLFLDGPYDALVTVEQDMILPPHALQTMTGDESEVVYGTYLLRHGVPVINALRYEGPANLGMSLSLYSGALTQAQKAEHVAVSGVGFGCTLIRRSVVERIPFRADSSGHAPDMAFARDCLRQGIQQVARLDVPCGHIHEGAILEMNSSTATVKVTVLQSVNVLVEGKSTALVEGAEIELSITQAKELADRGYVTLTKESAPKPAVPRRVTRS